MTRSKGPNVSVLVDAFLGIPWRQRRELGSLMFISDLSLEKSVEVRVRWCMPATLALRKWKQGDQEYSLEATRLVHLRKVKDIVLSLCLETEKLELLLRDTLPISDQIKSQDFLSSDFITQTTPSGPSSALAGEESTETPFPASKHGIVPASQV